MRSKTAMVHRSLLAVTSIFFAVSSLSGLAMAHEKTGCAALTSEEETHWVGNLESVVVENEARRLISGVVVMPSGEPLKGALVEVFTRPEYILELMKTPRQPIDGKLDAQGREYQKRVGACKTDASGKFSFSGLPPGNYELRVSSDDTYTGWNVSQVVVSVKPHAGGKKIRVRMSLGI